MVKLLLDYNADISASNKNAKANLHLASQFSSPVMVKTILDEQRDALGETDVSTALLRVAGKGRVDIVKMLLDEGADINMQG
jgi:Ankyrin repeats (3 copies)